MWELDYKENWALKSWCFWTVVLDKTLESPLNCKKIKPVNLKENQSWMFIGRTDAEAEAPIFWVPDAKNWLIWKDPDALKDWRQEEKGMTEDEMVAWHYWLDGNEFEQALGVGDGQGVLVCCSPWGCRESDMTEWLNWLRMNSVRESVPWLSHSLRSFAGNVWHPFACISDLCLHLHVVLSLRACLCVSFPFLWVHQ